MTGVKAMLIDDEPAARRLIRSVLETQADWVKVVAEASNGKDAIEFIDALKPDLIFLDIQMPDHTGFEVLEKIRHRPNVIFTTAYEEFAIKAFETFSIDYLLKPIREERLLQALEKFKQFGKLSNTTDLTELRKLVEDMQSPKQPTAFPIRQGEKIILLRFENISHFEADDKYVSVFTTDGKKFLSDQTLTSLSQKLPVEFLRVQKSFIINREKIGEIRKHFNGRFVIIMNDQKQTRITTGLTYYETIRSELGI